MQAKYGFRPRQGLCAALQHIAAVKSLSFILTSLLDDYIAHLGRFKCSRCVELRWCFPSQFKISECEFTFVSFGGSWVVLECVFV